MLRKFLLLTSLAFPYTLFSQDLIKLPELQKLIHQTGPVKVINFWATWCAPCVKEMPLFEKLNHDDKSIKVILVSMDYDLDPDPAKVKRFIERKKILAEENPNDWIEKIDKNWTGALPSTLVINPNSGKRKFIQGELKEGDLEKVIQEVSK